MILVLLLAGAVAGGAFLLPRRPSPVSEPGAATTATGQTTTLVALTQRDDPSQQADSLTLFASTPQGEHPVALFVPVGTLGQIPGQGFDEIGKALTFGASDLQRLTVENLTGIRIQRTIAVTDAHLEAIVDALGGVQVDIKERITEDADDGTRRVLYPMGPQKLDGAAAARYVTDRAQSTELERFVRARKVWDAIFDAGSARVAQAISAAGLSADDAGGFAAALAPFASADAGARTFEVLPAESAGAGGLGEVYRVDERRLTDLVARQFVPSRLSAEPRPRVEVRNGNGRPESGYEVASVLVPAGLRIEVTGNAPSFGYPSTRIVVYGDDEASLALGRKVRDLLGVGRVEVGTRGQTVVDVTIVVGRDFIARKG